MPDLVERLRAAGCVFAEDEAALLEAEARNPAQLEAMVVRRTSGVPLEYIVGWVEFCGLRIAVDDGVFVPRRRTEFLAQQAIALSRQSAIVVELCCGVGAIGAAMLDAKGDLELYAADIDPIAVTCARRNLGNVYVGDLYDPLPQTLRGRVDVLVANAPYVPTESIALMPPEARLYEAPIALDGGADGLDVARRVVADAPQWLVSGGSLLIETSEGQAAELLEIYRRNGLIPRLATSAELYANVAIGTVP